MESHFDYLFHRYSSSYNCKLDDVDTKNVMVQELINFKEAGGGTIVENTVAGISRDITWLKTLSAKSGVNIIAGTGTQIYIKKVTLSPGPNFCMLCAGFYVACSQPSETLSLKVEEIHDIMSKEVKEGENGVKAGIIGEIGISWPMHRKYFTRHNFTNLF